MQISFAGTIIAQEQDFPGGSDTIQGFVPKGTQNVQWKEYLRSLFATPKARGNAKQTMTGTITLASQPTLGIAMLARALIFVQMPKEGPLLFTQDGEVVTFPWAVLQDYTPVKNAVGVNVAFELTFALGGPQSQTYLPITTEAGVDLETESGSTLVS